MCFTLYTYQCYKYEGQYTGGFSQATVASLELLVKYVKITVIFNIVTQILIDLNLKNLLC